MAEFLSPEIIAALFTGINGILLFWINERRSSQERLKSEMKDLEAEVEELESRLEKSMASVDKWRDRYYDLRDEPREGPGGSSTEEVG